MPLNKEEFLQNIGNTVEIYTDGACSGNPGNGGWGVYIRNSQGLEYEFSGTESNTTNNRMEMMAAIEGLAIMPKAVEIHLYTDSQYLKNGITSWIKKWIVNNWRTADKKIVKNQDLWEKLHQLVQTRNIKWFWVPGHKGHFGNERADALARNAIVVLQLKK